MATIGHIQYDMFHDEINQLDAWETVLGVTGFPNHGNHGLHIRKGFLQNSLSEVKGLETKGKLTIILMQWTKSPAPVRVSPRTKDKKGTYLQ